MNIYRVLRFYFFFLFFQLHKRINKTNRDFTNYKYNLKRNSFVINTKTTIEQFNTFKNNYEHDINIIKQDITKLEMKMIQQSRVQEMKIGNLNKTISILQNEIEAIRRGLGGLPNMKNHKPINEMSTEEIIIPSIL